MTAREHLLILFVSVLFGLPVYCAAVAEWMERNEP